MAVVKVQCPGKKFGELSVSVERPGSVIYMS